MIVVVLLIFFVVIGIVIDILIFGVKWIVVVGC